MRARIACGIAILLLTACGEKTPPQSTDAGTQTMIDVRQSTVVAEPDKDVVADGETRSTITVTIKDIAGQPLPDFQVLLAAQGEGASITQPGGPTDANGIAVGFVTATKPGTVTISAKASNATNTYDLPSQAQVVFVAGEAKKLVFQVPPSAAQAGTTISPAIRIAVQDDFGNTLDSNIEVTVALGENPGGGTLSGTLTVAADKGTATFEDLRIDKAASGYTLVASAVGLESVASEPFEITAGAPASLSFLDVPASVVAGAAFEPPVRIAVLDPQGNLIPNATNIVTVTLGANPGQATLAGTLSVRANAGIATFSDLKLTKAATGYELVATASGLAGATSEPFTVAPAAPARLGFVVHPSTVTAGAAIAPAVQVAVEDAFGNRVTEASTTVTVALGTNPGTATLSGTTTVETAGGIATFDDLSLDKAARGYVLAASADGLTAANSNPFEVVAALPFRLSFLSGPTNTEAGATISPAVRVLIEDAYGNTVTGSQLPVALAIGDNPGNGTLTGTQLAYPTAGIATFPDLKINKAGIGYTLVASAMGSQLPTTTSAPFDIIPAAPIAISFRVQPSDVAAGSPITPAVEVSLLDRFDNLVTYATNQITLALGANPGNGHLLGTLTVGATGGVASFADLRIDRSASGYTLVASTSGLPTVTSEPFEVTGGAASRLAFVQQPSQATSNQPIAPPVQVEVLDAFGNRLLTATDPVTLSLEGGTTGAILSGTKTVTPVNGVASFADLSIDKAGTGYALRARASGLIGATSNAFSVVAGAPSSLAFLVQPQLSIVNQAMRPIIEVAVFDSAGNLTSGTHPVTMSLASNPTSAALNGTTTVSSVNGVASFQDLSVSKVGSGYTLSASLNGVPSVPSVTSDAFDVISGTASKLAFSVQPSNTVAGEEMAPSVEVRILDAFGNLVPSATHAISLAVGTGPGALLGNTTVVATNGVAVFPGLKIERAASGYTMVASASGLTNAISNLFNITPAAVSASVSTVLALPVDNVVADNSASSTITVTARDAFGNPVQGASVTLAATGGGNTLAQPTAVTNASGVATGSIKSTKAETKTITATVGATVLDARPQVRFVHGAPSASVSTVRASALTVVANGQATSTITVTVLDAYSNPVPGASVVLASSGSDNTLTTPPVTDGSGVTTATIASTKAEAKTITATVGSLVLAEKPVVTFVPGPVSASESLVAVNPADGLVANGSATSTITVTARDAFLNPIPNKTVVLSVAGAGDAAKNTLVQPTAPTSAAGVATGTLKSTWAEVKTITATVDGVELDAHPTITFVPGPVSATTSTVVATPDTGVIADNTALSTIVITVLDAFSNPIPDAAVTVTVSGAANTLSTPAPTDGSGKTTVTLKSTKAETKTITAKVGTTTLPTKTVTFVPGPVDPDVSTVAVNPADGLIANGSAVSTITVIALDAYSNPIPNKTVVLSVAGAGDAAKNTLVQPSAPTSAAGVATGTLKSTWAEVKTITATVDGVELNAHPTITFVPGPVSAATSTVVATPRTGVVADNTALSTIVVTVLDAFSNPIPNVNVTVTASGAANTLSTPAPTDSSGKTTATLKSTKAETKTITAKVGTTTLPTETVTFVPGPVDPDVSTVSVNPASGLIADGTAASTITVTALDAYSNPIPGKPVVLAVAAAGDPAKNTLIQPAAPTSATGVTTGSLKSTLAEVKTITATVDGVELDDRPTITFIPGSVSAATSTVVASPATNVVADGNALSTITITVLDAHSNPIPGATVTLTKSSTVPTLSTPAATNASGVTTATIKSTKAETVTITAKAGSTTLPTATVTFVPDVPDATKSTVSVSPATGVVANNIATATITATIRDANSNLISGATVAFASSNANDTLTPTSATSGENGVATATIASTKAEQKTITVTVNGTLVINATPTVTFVPGPPSASISTATAPADPIVADGAATSTIKVTVLDEYANPISGKKVTLSATGSGNTIGQPANTGANGVTTGTIKSTVAETKTITATVDGSPAVVIAQKPVVTFIPGAVNPASTFTVDRTTGIVADSVDVVTASVTIKDLKSNPIPGAQVVFAATGTGNIFNPASGTVTTAADGTASITLASTKAEAKTISVTAGGVALGTTRVVTFVAGPPTAENSTFTASPTSVLANNAAYADLTVTLRDAFNNPVPGQSVSLIATGSANKFTPVSGSTNALGAFLSKLQSSTVEKKRVLAETATFVLATEVTFFADPPVVVALSEPSGGGCVPITYSVKQLQSKRVDVVVEFRETATSSYVRATQAAGTSEGIYGITTSSAGASHTFLWNTTADVPRRAITGGTLKVTPYINGVPGTPLTAPITGVSNRLSFSAATQIASGREPVAIAVADLNGDAKLDLITANPLTADSPDQIMVLLGNANGSFATAKPYLSESSGTPPRPDAMPVAIAPFDFDLDGDIDLAVANSARHDVSIFINDGAGVFTPPKSPDLRPAFAVGDAPRALIAADLDLDGRRDLAVAHSSGVTVLLSASLYGTPFDHVVGANPSSLVSGDFNRDGLPDLAVANEGSNSVSVLLGLGAGDFAPAVEYAVGTNPSGVATGDFNADGILDLATSNRGSNDASVLLGTGTGAFGAAQNFKTGLDPLVPVAPASIGVADLDGDGALDLVVANELENTLSVLLGDGMGSFVPETRPLANGQPVSAVIGDFNGDSKPDLAAAAWDADAVQVILNSRPRRCDEGFDTASNAEVGPAPQAVASGDFNGDGKPDIAVIDGTEVNLRVLLGTGNGSYRPSTPVAIPGGAGNHIVAADFNADGKLDVATPNVLGATFFSGNGSGGFTSPTPTTNGMPPTALAAGDFNGDDKLDLATTVESGFVEVYLFNSSFGKLSTTYVCNGRPVCTPTHLTIADFNRDGRADIAFVDLANVRIMFGDGAGGFSEPVDFTAGSAPSFVMSADFNADGFADLAVANQASGTVHLLAGDGNGGFSVGPAIAVGTAPRWLTADRMNGDAHLDLVVGFSGERATKVLPGNGDMTFGAATAWDLAASPVAVATADFDGDGATDIAAVVASASPRVTTLLGKGDGTFPMPATYAAAGSPHKVFSADFDRDGALDLGVSALTGNHVRLFPGNADGTLAAALSTGASSPGAAAHADLNADGILDLVVASATTGKLLVMLGDGAGLFAAPVEYAFPGTSPAPSAVAVGDFNRDGALDVVVANGAANNVCFYYGAGGGALGAATDCTVVGDLPVAIAIGDFDGNGRLDVATANSGIHNVGILLGHDGSQYPANFEPLRSFPTGTYPVGIVAIDLDRNGTLDLVTANKNGDSISVLAGLGNGNFSPHVQYAAPGSPTGIFASDLDDDGKPDILVPILGNGVAVFPGNGNNTFAAPVGYYLDADVYDLADFDRDGQPDLGFARTLSDRVGLCMGL